MDKNFRAPRVARYRGVALVRPYTVREIAKSRNQNREIRIAESRNRGIADSRNGELESEIGNMPRQLESEIAIWNRKMRSESEIANRKSEIESQTCHVR